MMTKTTDNAAKTKKGNASHTVVKKKNKPNGSHPKVPLGKTSKPGAKFSRQNARKSKNGANKAKDDSNGNPNQSSGKGKQKGKSVSFSTNVSTPSFSKSVKKLTPKKQNKNGKSSNAKPKDGLSKSFTELLKQIEPVLATQPKYMHGSTREFALSMLTHHNTITHKVSVLKKFNTRPEYIPASARFKFTLTCCADLINDTDYQAAANEIQRDIESLQQKIRDKTKNIVEIEINVLKKKFIKEAFNWCMRVMKSALIYFKDNNTNINFNKSDNSIIKSGIIQYFSEQKHDEYCRYFAISRNDLITHFTNLKDSLFNDNELSSTSSTVSNANEETTPPSASFNTTKTTLHESSSDLEFLRDVQDCGSDSNTEDHKEDDTSVSSECSLMDNAMKVDEYKKKIDNENKNKSISKQAQDVLTKLHTPGFDNIQGIYYVKDHLSKLLPRLTYRLQQSHTQKVKYRQTDKKAEAVFNNWGISEATDAVANALDKEKTVAPEAMGGLIKEIVSEELNQRAKQSKNCSGGHKTPLSPPKPTGTSNSSQTPIISNKKRNTTMASMNQIKRAKIESNEIRSLKNSLR